MSEKAWTKLFQVPDPAVLKVTREPGLLRLMLAAPESKNKLSIALLEMLLETLKAEDSSSPAAVSLESTSSSIFAAGADMNELLGLNEQTALAYAALGQAVTQALACFKPAVTALVSGPCFGGGFDLVLSCPRVWASESALFCHPGAALGIMTGFGGTIRLPARIPVQVARLMLLSGQALTAKEALHYGLVERIFPDHQSMLKAFLQSGESLNRAVPQVF